MADAATEERKVKALESIAESLRQINLKSIAIQSSIQMLANKR